MRTFKCALIVLALALSTATGAEALGGISSGMWTPNVTLGIHQPYFPDLYQVPGYPIYYAPRVYANYFFYDSMFWLFHDERWYCSYWYDGPWWFVEPVFIPFYILRIPVFYYMRPPPHFNQWHLRHPPHWGEYWGHEWERQRRGWDRWDRHFVPPPAPLPIYQRQYSGERYPAIEKQFELRDRYYRYQPQDKTYREHIQPQIDKRRHSPSSPTVPGEPRQVKQRLPDKRYGEPSMRVAPPTPVKPSPQREDRRELTPAPAEKIISPSDRDRKMKVSPGSTRAEDRNTPAKPVPPSPQKKVQAVEDPQHKPGAVQNDVLEQEEQRREPPQRGREREENDRLEQKPGQEKHGD